MKSALVVLVALTCGCMAAPKPGKIAEEAAKDPPKSFDWRKHGVISPVRKRPKDDPCGRVTVLDSVESMYAMQSGHLVDLSFAEVSDCLPEGVFTSTFQYLSNFGGFCNQTSYPTSRGECKQEPCVVAKINGQMNLPNRNVDVLVRNLLLTPLMTFFHGTLPSFKNYTGGIYEDSKCRTNHHVSALQIVGYGEEDGKEFWICKNNYGTDWGEDGYIRMKKGVNMCGVETFLIYPW